MDFLTLIDKLTPVLVVIIQVTFRSKVHRILKRPRRKSVLFLINRDLEKSASEVAKIGKENKDNLTLIGKGLQRLQRFRLQENLKKAIKRGETNQHEIEELSKLYESYVELGGNGAVKVLFEKFLELEIKEEN